MVSCCCHLVIKSCPTLCNHIDFSPPGFSVHGISQASILEWAAILLQGIFLTQVEPVSPAFVGGFSTTEPPGKPNSQAKNLGLGTSWHLQQLRLHI